MRVPPEALVTLLLVFHGSRAAGAAPARRIWIDTTGAEEVRAHYRRLEKTREMTRHPCSPTPDIIAAEIVDDLQATLAQFAETAADLKR